MHISISAVLTEIFSYYYASRASPAIKIMLFWKLNVNDFRIFIKSEKK
jgi:hypothetical protein